MGMGMGATCALFNEPKWQRTATVKLECASPDDVISATKYIEDVTSRPHRPMAASACCRQHTSMQRLITLNGGRAWQIEYEMRLQNVLFVSDRAASLYDFPS